MAGRMEFGPIALGARSIPGDPRRRDTQTVMNLKIKYRESFRPFAPTLIEEKASEYFEIDKPLYAFGCLGPKREMPSTALYRRNANVGAPQSEKK